MELRLNSTCESEKKAKDKNENYIKNFEFCLNWIADFLSKYSTKLNGNKTEYFKENSDGGYILSSAADSKLKRFNNLTLISIFS